jgi:aminopeptidase N
MKVVFSLFVASLVTFSAWSQSNNKVKPRAMPYDPASVPREHPLDFQHLRLTISFDESKGLVKGKVMHSFKVLQPSVDSVFLDGPGIKVKSIQFRNSELTFKTSKEGITLYFKPALKWETIDSITIDYEANPRKGLYFIGWNDPTNRSRKQIWSQGQGIDNRHWIPMYDEQNDKVTSELIVDMKNPFKVLSNGVFLYKKDMGNNITRWHYRMNKPHATYLIMLGVGEYETKEVFSKSGVKSTLYMYPDWMSRFETTYLKSADMIDFFEKEIGVKYPWENYSQIPVQDFMYGAMENTTATLFGDFFCVDNRGFLDRNYVAVNAHELAHQWFGDKVTARSGTHHWLQESFATHYNWLYEREFFGQDHYDFNRRNAQLSAFEASKKDKQPIASSEAGTTRWYPKGAFVLHMLKYVTGREAYNKAIKHYLLKHAYDNVDSEDLLIAFHETLGLSLDWFWDQWIYRGGEPVYEVKTDYQNDKTIFKVKQLQDSTAWTGYFKMPIQFQVWYTDGSCDSLKVMVDKNTNEVVVQNSLKKKVAFSLFDPNNEILKMVVFEKTLEELKQQGEKAPHMLDRLDAILAMDKFPMKDKQDWLMKQYNKEKFHAIKQAILEQMSTEKGKAREKLFTSAISDADHKVRSAALACFDTIPQDLIKSFEKMLQEPSYQTQTQVLAKLCLSNPAKRNEYLKATANEKNEIFRIEWLKQSIKSGNNEMLDQLIDFASLSFEFRARMAAMSALVDVNMVSEKALTNMIDAALNPNSRLSSSAVSQLSAWQKKNTAIRPLLQKLKPQEMPEFAEEVWKKILK